MSPIQSLPEIKNKSSFETIFNSEFENFIHRYPVLRELKNDAHFALELSAQSLQNNKKILTCGNGGSAADAEHIVGELLKGFLSQREYNDDEMIQILPNMSAADRSNYGKYLQKPLRAISLMGHPSFQSAYANDKHPEYALAQHILALGDKNDVLIAISTSGNSKNVLHCVRIAKGIGIKVIGLTGQTGGELAKLADVCIKVPSNKVHEVQEYHLPLYHFYCYVLEQFLFAK